MAEFGSIVTELAVDRRNWETGLAGASRDVKAFQATLQGLNEDIDTVTGMTGLRRLGSEAQATGGEVTKLGMTGRRASMLLLELSRGAEDAASQFGTQGLAGAIRGGANNLSAFATMIHPLAGVVAGVGAALGAVLIPRLLESGTAAKDAAKSIEDYKRAWSGFDVAEFNLGAMRRPETDDFLTPKEAGQRQGDAEFELTRAREERFIAEARALEAGGPDFVRRVMANDPRLGASVVLQMAHEARRRNDPSGRLHGTGPLPEGWEEARKKLIDAEAELNRARLAEMRAQDVAREAGDAATLAGQREGVGRLIGAGTDFIGGRVGGWWLRMQIEKKRRDDEAKENEKRQRDIDALTRGLDKDDRLHGVMRERADRIRAAERLFPEAADRSPILSRIDQAAIADLEGMRRRERERKLGFEMPLAGTAVRGQSADAINTLRAAMLRPSEKTEEQRIQEEELKEARETNKLVNKLIDIVKENPGSIPTQM